MYTHVRKVGDSAFINFVDAAPPIKPPSLDDIYIEENKPWPKDWVNFYYGSRFRASDDDEEEDWEDDWEEDDEYSDETFIDDTGAQIKDAPALDIL